jgi:outer membrane protein assembly factor BamE (lipoprotein component of BamABCDE complex)
MKTPLSIVASCALALIILSACAPIKATRGNMLDDFQMRQIMAGTDTRDDVVRKVGSPTAISPFDNRIWYYIGQKTEKHGILDPKVTQERIVVVTFGADGIVDSVRERRDGRENVQMVDRVTPTSGNEYTFLQQLLGNLGRFNRPAGNAATTAGGN